MLRFLDLVLSFLGLLFGLPIFILIYLLIYFDSKSPLYWQERLGRNKKPFLLVKFRTMKINTDIAATHLIDAKSITKYGKFLRSTKLDELPQLWNILKGEMSLVGPRPGLLNQKVLTDNRDSLGVYLVRPGITGLAQVQNIDMSTPKDLAFVDAKMISEMSVKNYFRYIVLTFIGYGQGDKIRK